MLFLNLPSRSFNLISFIGTLKISEILYSIYQNGQIKERRENCSILLFTEVKLKELADKLIFKE